MANTISGPGSLSGSGTTKTEIIYNLGDTGPGGGIVFYDAGSVLSWGRYLEAWPNNTWSGLDHDPQGRWASNNNTLVGGTSSAIGTGLANSNAVVALYPSQTGSGIADDVYVVAKTRAFNGGGKTDWYLPSKEELGALFNNKNLFTGWRENFHYKSSTEYDYRQMWMVSAWFQNGLYYTEYLKENPGQSRPVRAF